MPDNEDGGTATLQRPNPLRSYPAPDFRDKVSRVLWSVVNVTLYRCIPTPFFGVRSAIMRRFGAKIAEGAHPYPGAMIWAPWNLVMQENSCIANGVRCYNVARIIIGKDAIVSQGTYLCSPSHDFRDPGFPLVAADIEIRANAWVATDAFIGPGVIVGTNAVVGARAVATKSIPDNAIVTGNPARIVGRREMTGAP